MSRAFVNEDLAAAQVEQPVERQISTLPNYVTPLGFAELQAKVAELHSQHSAQTDLGDAADQQQVAELERDLRYFSSRLHSAQVVNASTCDKVQIGSRVTFADEQDQQQSVQLVGEDQADDVEHRADEHHRPHHREVLRVDGVDRVAAQARNREEGFHQQAAHEQQRDRHHHPGQDRDQRVAQHVAEQHR